MPVITESVSSVIAADVYRLLTSCCLQVINETSCYSKLVIVELGRLSKQNPIDEIVDDVTNDINVDDLKQVFHTKMTLACVPRE